MIFDETHNNGMDGMMDMGENMGLYVIIGGTLLVVLIIIIIYFLNQRPSLQINRPPKRQVDKLDHKPERNGNDSKSNKVEFCPNCGAELRNSLVQFCPLCGTNINK